MKPSAALLTFPQEGKKQKWKLHIRRKKRGPRHPSPFFAAGPTRVSPHNNIPELNAPLETGVLFPAPALCGKREGGASICKAAAAVTRFPSIPASIAANAAEGGRGEGFAEFKGQRASAKAEQSHGIKR